MNASFETIPAAPSDAASLAGSDTSADTSDMAVCPFDETHRMLRHRMPYHLVRCQRKYGGPRLVACAFNAMHRVRAEEMPEHLTGCEDYRKNQVVMYEAAAAAEAEAEAKEDEANQQDDMESIVTTSVVSSFLRPKSQLE